VPGERPTPEYFNDNSRVAPILIDITRLTFRRLTRPLPTGIDRVCIEYLRHYGEQARAVLCLGPFSAVLSEADSRRAFAYLLAPDPTSRVPALVFILKAFLWRWLRVVRGPSYLINTSHIGLENRHYAWALRRWGARPVVMVHDLIPISHPEYCRPAEYEAHHQRMRSAATLSAGIVANSQVTLDAFKTFCREDGVTAPPSAVALLAPGLAHLAQGLRADARPIAEPYFVVLGTIEPRKNHWMLLQIWRDLCEKLGAATPKLVVIGQRGWECENVVDLLERCRPLRGIVVEKGRCTDAELVTYLHHATALLFPSFVEGYGMPLTEALSLGVPVIASDIAVFHEIAGDVPDYACPLDGRRWEALITDYAQPDSALRAAQMLRIARYAPTTWAAHFQTVDMLLLQLQSPSRRPLA